MAGAIIAFKQPRLRRDAAGQTRNLGKPAAAFIDTTGKPVV